MTKRREPVDPFGLSLLDVLSNALGGLILLTLVVAVTVKGNDKRRLNLPQEVSQGKNYTVITIPEKQNPQIETDLLIAQIKLYGAGAQLSITGEGDYKKHCSLSHLNDTSDVERNLMEWLVIRNGKMEGEWEVMLNENKRTQYPDSIAVLITWSDLVTCHQIEATPKGELVTILQVTESKNGQPTIQLFGKACDLNPKQ